MKEVKKEYVVRAYGDGDIIDEIKLLNSNKKLMVLKYDRRKQSCDEVMKMYQFVGELNPDTQVLCIPKEAEIEVLEIVD